MQLPLLLNAVPKVNLVGPKVYLEEGTWIIKGDDETLMFSLLFDDSHGELFFPKSEYKEDGGRVFQIRIVEVGTNQRVSIFSEKVEN